MNPQQTQNISLHRYLFVFIAVVCVYMFYLLANADLQPNVIELKGGSVEVNGQNVLSNAVGAISDRPVRMDK